MDNKTNILINLEKKGTGANEAISDIKKVKNEVETINKEVKKISDSTSDINKTVNVSGIATALSKVSQKLIESVKKSADYIETLNLLDVAYDGNTKKVREWTKQYSEILNLDDSTLISSASHFKVLSQSMGLATETGEKFAKLLSQMTLDVSSLYNMDFSKAQTALQYAVEGRGTSLKQRTGVSVLETSVQTTLDTLGIEAYVENMNDAEKAIARLISMEYQLRASQGDLARTIEAPANQFRILGEQASLAARGIGNIFLSAVANILPYINALLIAINKILAAIAGLFGYSEGMFDFFGTGDVSSLTDSFNELGGAVGGVGGAADSARKKLLGLRGFDKLNVIKTPSSSGGGGGAGGGAGGAINPKLLEAFNKMADLYDAKLDGIKTKASEISEEILKWLGFQKNIDDEWEFTHITAGTVLTVAGGILATSKLIFGIIKKINGGTGLLGSKTLIGELKLGWDIFSKAITSGGLVALTAIVGSFAVAVKNYKQNIADLEKGADLSKVLTNTNLGDWLATIITPMGKTAGDTATIIKVLTSNIDELGGVSKKTKDKWQDLELSIGQMQIDSTKLQIDGSKILTEEQKNKILDNLTKFTDKIHLELEKQRTQSLKDLNDLVAQGFLTPEEMLEAEKRINEYYGNIEKETSDAQKRIEELIKKSKTTKLTKDELDEMSKLYDKLGENMVSAITDSKKEQEILLSNLKDNSIKYSKESASEMIKNAIETKDEIIKNAEEQYTASVEKAKKLYEAGAITKGAYDEIKAQAKDTKEKTIKDAEEQYDAIWEEFSTNQKDIASYIDKDTGGVKSGWARFWDKLFGKSQKTNEKVKSDFSTTQSNIELSWKNYKLEDKTVKIKGDTSDLYKVVSTIDTIIGGKKYKMNTNASGEINFVKYANGGLPPVGQMFIANERGPELVGQIGGQSFVANQNQMMDIIDKKLSNAGGLQNATFVIQVGSEEVARTVLKDLNSMAKSNGKPITIGG